MPEVVLSREERIHLAGVLGRLLGVRPPDFASQHGR